jgi:hypothetical protein
MKAADLRAFEPMARLGSMNRAASKLDALEPASRHALSSRRAGLPPRQARQRRGVSSGFSRACMSRRRFSLGSQKGSLRLDRIVR